MLSTNRHQVVLVTGASGFVAEHLIPVLKNKHGCTVIGVDRKDQASASCDFFIQCDLNDIDIKQFKQLPQIDLVYHLAAARADWGISDEEYFADNFDASVSLISLLEVLNVSEVVFVSSVSVMPQSSSNPQTEQSPIEPINAYGLSKAKAEKHFEKFAKMDSKICLKIIRPVVLYGPSDPQQTGLYRAVDNNIFRLIDGIFKNRFAIVGNGSTVKSTAYVHNFVAALTFIVDSKPGIELFVYTDEPPKTTLELVQMIRRNLGKSGNGIMVNYHLAVALAWIFDPLSKLLKVNFPITKARIDTFLRPTNFIKLRLNQRGFQQPVSSEKAIADTVEWYKALHKYDQNNFFFFRDKS